VKCSWCVVFCKNRFLFICRIAQHKRTIVFIRISYGIRTRCYNVRVVRNPVYVRPLGLCGGNILLSADGKSLLRVSGVIGNMYRHCPHERVCPKMVRGGHGRSWFVVMAILGRRECFTRISSIGDRFQKQAHLCLHVNALGLVHRPQKIWVSIPNLICNTLGHINLCGWLAFRIVWLWICRYLESV
jgi:hypothetical protein